MSTDVLPYRVLLSACADEAAAARIADALVEEGLAACVTLLPGARSVYRWQGQTHRTGECLLLIKARAADYPALEARLLELHPYEVPELLALPVLAGNPTYLAWLDARGR